MLLRHAKGGMVANCCSGQVGFSGGGTAGLLRFGLLKRGGRHGSPGAPTAKKTGCAREGRTPEDVRRNRTLVQSASKGMGVILPRRKTRLSFQPSAAA